jgi:hypothetical protein
MFGVANDGTHDFGYPCAMPRVIRIDGLEVGDTGRPGDPAGVALFDRPLGALGGKAPFPYRPTERVEIRGLKTPGGIPLRVSHDPAVAKGLAVRLELVP